jgi:integrase
VTRKGAGGAVDLTPPAIYGVLTKRTAEAGINPLSPHDLRRTFVGDLFDAGVDLSGALAIAGHASPLTTARYDRRGEATRANVERLFFPYCIELH